MIIIHRYLLREIGLSFLAVVLVLALMFLSGTFVRLLAETLEGRYPADLLLTLFALRSVGSLVLLLPFAMFMAVMLALGRLYRDSEMTVLLACGYGPLQLLKPVAIAAGIAALLVALLSLHLAPWAEDRAAAVLDEAGARSGIESIVSGQFNSFDGSVVYVERVDSTSKRLFGVFAVLRTHDTSIQLTAESGREYVDRQSGDRYLLLLNGYRYEGEHGQASFRITHFDEHGLRIQERAVVPSERRRSSAATMALWQAAGLADITELQWRLAMPLSTLLLALLAVPLSRSTPRQGRLFGLFLGVLVYLGYNNVLNIARSALSKGDVPPGVGLWWVHLLLLLLIAALFWYQLRMPAPKGRRGGGA